MGGNCEANEIQMIPYINIMKKCFLFMFIFVSTFSFGQSWLWGAKGITSSDTWAVAIGNNGSAYLGGSFGNPFWDTAIFGNNYLVTLNADAFLIKYDSNGNIIWAEQSKLPSSNGFCGAVYINSDVQGNIYSTGYFYDTVFFGADTLKSYGPFSSYFENVFLTKYNANGNVLWAKQSNSPTYYSMGIGMAVATDISKNILLTGYFVDTISFGALTLRNIIQNDSDIFLVKYDSTGNVLWARQSIDSGYLSGGYPYSVTSDNTGNIYITGTFLGCIKFGAYTLRSLSTTNLSNLLTPHGDAFLVKYDKNGNVLWAVQSKSFSLASFCNSYSVITDAADNVYITGTIYDTVAIGSFILRDEPLPNSYYGDLFLAKYTLNGKILWVKQSHSTAGGWSGYSLAKDKINQLYLSGGGAFGIPSLPIQSIRFGLDTLNIQQSIGGDPAIIFKLDTAGNTLCGSIISTGGDDANGIACSPSGQFVYLGGDILDTISFGKDFLTDTVGETPFIARWQSCDKTAGISSINPKKENISLFPNPNNGQFTIAVKGKEGKAKSNVAIYNMLGEEVYTETSLPQTPKGALSEINIANQPNGVYLYRVTDENGALLGEGKFIIQK